MASDLPAGRGWDMIAAFTTITAVSVIAYSTRLYVRLRLVKRSSEDWVAGVGCLLFVIFYGVSIVGPFHGTGQHTNLVPLTEFSTAVKFYWLSELFFAATNIAVKQSIAQMLLRYVVEDHHKKMIYIVTGTMHICSVVILFCITFQCQPISFFWTQILIGTEGQGQCMEQKTFFVISAFYSFATILFDWTMAVLPWFLVRKMQLDLQTRLMVTFVLALGSIASIATIIRIPYFAKLRADDFLYTSPDIAIWSCFETGLSITASSAAALRPLFRKKSSQGGGLPRWTPPKLNTIPVTDTDVSNSTAIVTDNTLQDDSTPPKARTNSEP